MIALKTATMAGGVLAAGISLAVLIGAAATRGKVATPSTTPATQPATYTVKKGTLALDISLDGTLQPAEPYELRLKFKDYSGPLTVVNAAAPWAKVRKGDVLLELEQTHYKWAMEQAENDLASARAGMAKAQADAENSAKADALALRIQEDAVKNAKSGLEWWNKVDGPQLLLGNELAVRQAKYRVDDQTDELEQLRNMYGAKELTSVTADIVIKRAIRAMDLAKTNLKMQQERYERFSAQDYPQTKQKVADGIEQAENALASLKTAQAQLAVRRVTAVSSARIALEQAERKYNELKGDGDLLMVKAPFDGMVVYGRITDGAWQGGDPKALKAGEKLSSGQLVMREMVPGKLQIEISVPENKAFAIEPGAKAKVTPAAMPYVSYEAGCSPLTAGPRGNPPVFAFMTTASVPDADPRLLPGMKAMVEIEAKKEEMLIVPVSAVSEQTVWVKRGDGGVEKRAVTLGRSDGHSVEVRSGLTEGEEILTNPDKQ